jgi:Tfp pilus assembly major pilin PilA
MNFQYPTYESAPNALTLSRPPLLRVRFANYITDGNGGPLLCAMKGMSYDPVDNFDIGKNPRVVDGTLVPVRISVNMELRVLHESASRSFLNGKSVVFGKLTARRPPTASTTETNVNGVTQAQADKDNTPPAESQAALIDGEFWTGANDSGISNSDALDQNYNEQLFSDAAAQNAANLDSSRTRMTVNERFWSYPFITDDVFPRRGDK